METPSFEERLADNHARVAQILVARAALDAEWEYLQAEQARLIAEHHQEPPQEGLTNQ